MHTSWGLGLCVAVALSLGACREDDSDSGASEVVSTTPESPSDTPTPPTDVPDNPAATVRRAFAPSSADFPNPERGFHEWIDLANGRDFAWVRSSGYTLAYAGVNLGAYRSSLIDGAFLAKLAAGFAAVRAAGIKVILRFLYNNSLGDGDAPKSRILEHIAQLASTLRSNADVIAVLQAGFIGAWGEWHGSTNGLDNTTDRRDILMALLDAMPASRFVQIRTPHFKQQIFGRGPLQAPEAFSGQPFARVGHHNDAFMGSEDDYGTYLDPVESWKDWVAQDARFTPNGGETNDYNARSSDAQEAQKEMARLHWSFINRHYEPSVLASWESAGAMPAIRRNLGYRLTLQEAAWPSSVPPGGLLELDVRLRNDGYAALYNERPLHVVLSGGSTRMVARISSVDPRRWEAGTEASFRLRLQIPGSATAGTYRLSLWLPDAADSIRSRPPYAVRLANDGLWDAATGDNVLTETLSVTGPPVSSATAFQEIR